MSNYRKQHKTLQVLKLRSKGLTSRQIGSIMNIHHTTVSRIVRLHNTGEPLPEGASPGGGEFASETQTGSQPALVSIPPAVISEICAEFGITGEELQRMRNKPIVNPKEYEILLCLKNSLER